MRKTNHRLKPDTVLHKFHIVMNLLLFEGSKIYCIFISDDLGKSYENGWMQDIKCCIPFNSICHMGMM